MIILGVNGWPHGGHNASACIVKDGKVLMMAEEERFIRKKHASDVYPHASIQYCLSKLGISFDEVDQVAFSWDLPLLYGVHGYNWSQEEEAFINGLFPAEIFGQKKRPKVEYVRHHLAHAASVFWFSGFEQSSILIMDGEGETCSVTLAYGDREKRIKTIRTLDQFRSLGFFYKAVSGHIGLGQENPGKTMGLASYGSTDAFGGVDLVKYLDKGFRFSIFKGEFEYSKEQKLDATDRVVSNWRSYFSGIGIPAAPVEERWNFEKNCLDYHHPDVMMYKDFAAWAQHVVEDISFHLVRELTKLTNCSNLSLSGGVALNCSMNGKIMNLEEVGDMFVFPAANDAGTAVGAALELGFRHGIIPEKNKMTLACLGPKYDDQDIESLLRKLKLPYVRLSDNDLFSFIAGLINSQKIVAVFRGRSEIGPRALGNRSILASPRSSGLRDLVNRVKRREKWRPLCPSVLRPYADEYFIDGSKGSSFMLRSLRARQDKKHLIPGVVHVDDTARIQIVEPDTDYGQIIDKYRELSGVPMVLNTSFNLAGEPIVGSPVDAIRSFFTSELDVLILNNYVIQKERERQ